MSEGAHVLVVEDEDALRRVAARLMQRAGYRVSAAGGGGEALALLQDADPPVDLLLTDVVMPAMLGPELAKQALALRPGLPVLFMSGHIGPHIVLGDVPHAGLVEKPFTEASLGDAVRAALS